MARRATNAGLTTHHVSLVAVPDAVVSTLFGIYDVMNAFRVMGISSAKPGSRPPFQVEIVGESAGRLGLASGVAIDVQRAVESIEATDIVIVPSILLRGDGWAKTRYPRLVDWLRRVHDRGAVLCSACSGNFSAGRNGTVRWQGRDSAFRLRTRVRNELP